MGLRKKVLKNQLADIHFKDHKLVSIARSYDLKNARFNYL